MSIKSKLLFALRARLSDTRYDVGKTPLGYRAIVIVDEGAFEGPTLRGRVIAGGADWSLMRADGVMEVDVRLTLQTHDDALIYMTYTGLIREGRKAFKMRAQGVTPSPEEIYFRTTPRFETGDERYAWLNSTIAVGVGLLPPDEVHYEIYEIL